MLNALDNVNARRYVDQRCMANKIPLIDSGTLGTKGHIQTIIPNKTESYTSKNDPESSTEIPVCTLKMFPEEADHCIEWSRDKFEKLFFKIPQILENLIEMYDVDKKNCSIKDVKKVLGILSAQSSNIFEDFIPWARKKFEKYFVNDVKQLLHVYPPEHKLKDGKLFWTLPKRLPQPLSFDANDEMCQMFIQSMATIMSRVFHIKVDKNVRSADFRMTIALASLDTQIDEFIPDEKKSKKIT